MPCSPYVSPLADDRTTRIEEKCRSYNSDDLFSVHVFLSDHIELSMEISRCVCYELDTEITLDSKALV